MKHSMRERANAGQPDLGEDASAAPQAGPILSNAAVQRLAASGEMGLLVPDAIRWGAPPAALGYQPQGAPATQPAHPFVPEQASQEMIGRRFTLSESVSRTHPKVDLPAGTVVVVTLWENTLAEVLVGAPDETQFWVPKRLLRPVYPDPSKTTLALYQAGVAEQAATVRDAEAKLAAWEQQREAFKKQPDLFDKELDRQKGLLAKREKELNKRLIQETMYNRFDPIIKREVDEANAAHKLTGPDALDPELVKSMLFQESEMGTAGIHLMAVPDHPVRSRFNVVQVVDSSGIALFRYLQQNGPHLIEKYKLGDLLQGLESTQQEHRTLRDKKHRTADEAARLAELETKLGKNGEKFIWTYRAPGEAEGFYHAVLELFDTTCPPRYLNYEFWIHVAVFWLFEKRKETRSNSWPEVIRAYNGKGAPAARYSKPVVDRAAAADAAAARGQRYTPSH